MSRPRSPNPRVPLKVYLDSENLAKLKLATFSSVKGRPAHGAARDIVNDALAQYFNRQNQEQPNVQP